MTDCIFCKIVNGELPSAKIWEDEDYLAVLDSNPNTKGQTIVMTKKHYDSYIFDMPKNGYKNFMATTKRVAKLLEKGINAQRVALVAEGMGINHAHIKLYPLHGLEKKNQEIFPPAGEIYFDKYEGYLSTRLGPKKPIEELTKLAREIRK